MELSLEGTKQVTVSLGSRIQRRGNLGLLWSHLGPADRIRAALGSVAAGLPKSFSTVSIPSEALPEVRDDAYSRMGQLMEAIFVDNGERSAHKDLGAVSFKVGRHPLVDLVTMNSAVVDIDKFMSRNMFPRNVVS